MLVPARVRNRYDARLSTSVAVALLLAAPVCAPAAAQDSRAARKKIDVSTLGPQAGGRVPDFSLPDQTGRIQTLQSIMGSRGAMLVFLRSADW